MPKRSAGSETGKTFTPGRIEHERRESLPRSVALVHAARTAGVRVAVVTSSRNARQVLKASGLLDLFEIIVDGLTAAEDALPGKPAPDTYVYAASLLGVPVASCVVVEDATSGIEAGRRAPFGLVVGVDRGVTHEALLAAGADIVVNDLDELIPHLGPERMPHRNYPSANAYWHRK